MTRSFFSLLVLLVRKVGGMQDYWMVITKVTNKSFRFLVFFVRLLLPWSGLVNRNKRDRKWH